MSNTILVIGHDAVHVKKFEKGKYTVGLKGTTFKTWTYLEKQSNNKDENNLYVIVAFWGKYSLDRCPTVHVGS